MIVSTDFYTHWKTKLLIRKLGSDGIIALQKLWLHCQCSKSQRIEADLEIIASITDWQGDPESLERALIEAKFAKRDGRHIVMHGWEERNAKLLANYSNGKSGGRPKKEGKKQQASDGHVLLQKEGIEARL
jgi:hypothetical protein